MFTIGRRKDDTIRRNQLISDVITAIRRNNFARVVLTCCPQLYTHTLIDPYALSHIHTHTHTNRVEETGAGQSGHTVCSLRITERHTSANMHTYTHTHTHTHTPQQRETQREHDEGGREAVTKKPTQLHTSASIYTNSHAYFHCTTHTYTHTHGWRRERSIEFPQSHTDTICIQARIEPPRCRLILSHTDTFKIHTHTHTQNQIALNPLIQTESS